MNATITDTNDSGGAGAPLDLLATLVLDVEALHEWLREQASPEVGSSGLDLLSTLLLDPEAQRRWLHEQKVPEIVSLAGLAFSLLGVLKSDTAWDVRTLLDELGCKKRSRSDLDGLREPELHQCCSFLGWVTELLALAPDQHTRRLTSGLATTLYIDSGEDLEDCKLALDARMPGDEYTPTQLIEIGETGTAMQFARLLLSRKSAKRHHASYEQDLFGDEPQPHIRIPTLDALLREEIGVPRAPISYERAGRLQRHLQACTVCKAAHDTRAARYGYPTTTVFTFRPLTPIAG
jgi:hypothetical protein